MEFNGFEPCCLCPPKQNIHFKYNTLLYASVFISVQVPHKLPSFLFCIFIRFSRKFKVVLMRLVWADLCTVHNCSIIRKKRGQKEEEDAQ